MAEADRGLPGQVTIAVNMANPSGVQLNIVEQRLSAERLGPYRAAVGGDLAEALALYRWNILLSGAFYELLQDTEVVLRNAIHAQLTGHNGGNGFWFQRPGWFTSGTNTEITQARQRVRRSGQVETPGHIVAELNFGFWRFLLTRQYDRRQILRHGPSSTPLGQAC